MQSAVLKLSPNSPFSFYLFLKFYLFDAGFFFLHYVVLFYFIRLSFIVIAAIVLIINA